MSFAFRASVWLGVSIAFAALEIQASPLDLAKRSAELVRLHDRASWLDLYGSRATIEDPVGTVVHEKEAERLNLETFWEVFIAPNEIVFESHFDLDRPDIAIRDVTIHTKSPSGLLLDVPAFVMYRPHPQNPSQVASMRAFWEVKDQFRKAKAAGELGTQTSNAMLKRIFHFEGLPGLLGFAKGFFAPVKSRRETIWELFGAEESVRERDVPFSLNGVRVDESVLESGGTLTLGKILVSGPEAIARISVGQREGFLQVTFGAGRSIRSVDFFF